MAFQSPCIWLSTIFYSGMNLIALKYTCGANATTTIKRSNFGVDKYVPKVGDEVKIAIQDEATRD